MSSSGPAGAADQVVVMPGAGAGTVERLTVRALERIGVTLGGEPRERTVHRGQADAGVLVAQERVERLCTDESGGVGERLADALTLPGVALSHGGKSTGGPSEPPGSGSCGGHRGARVLASARHTASASADDAADEVDEE